jgi:hypothetical protein
MAKRLGLRLGRPNLEVFAGTLIELARANRQVMVVTSDSRGSAKLEPFAAEFPDQLVEVGIAEQNLVGVAAGLASCGKERVRGVARLLSHRARPGTDQERRGLFGSRGASGGHQRGRELRCAGQHAPLLA